MSKISELDTLVYEYRKVKNVSLFALKEEIIHNPDFQLWLSDIVMDTVNYEKILLQILEAEFINDMEINRIAEIGSKPILSSSEKITKKLVPTYNYSNFSNDFKVNSEYQKNYSYLNNDADYIDLLLIQSNQFENVNKQRDKLVFIHRLSTNKSIPFIIGCYGDCTSREFKEKSIVLTDFSRVTDCVVKIYNETYNGLDCQFLIGSKQKIKVHKKIRCLY